MMLHTWRPNPHLFEINTPLFIRRVSAKHRRRLTLATVPDEEWQVFRQQGFDLLWLMGVWRRSPAARQEALQHPGLRREYERALPDWTDADVQGSPYAIYDYSLDPSLGGAEELAQLKVKLNRLGLGLILDFVPNHLAVDHPWVYSHPEWFVPGSEADARAHPAGFFAPREGLYLAHGRDPNFPPWTDSAQLNLYSSGLRQALIGELLRIAGVANGVRCDMAMLVLDQVFEQTWGKLLSDYPRPPAEFWAEALGQVREKKPDFLFLAEAYWGFERQLQRLGFDFTYDKALYDRLRHSFSDEIRSYLQQDGLSHKKSVRFIENHDEPRAVTAFGRERSLAAAIAMATLPGLRLFHCGQLEGRRIHLPVQLVREPVEDVDAGVAGFYSRLLAIADQPAFHNGAWQMLETGAAWPGNESYRNLLAWAWQHGRQGRIAIINYSGGPAQGRVRLSLPDEMAVTLYDELNEETYVRDPGELSGPGLYIALEPWRAHLLRFSSSPQA